MFESPLQDLRRKTSQILCVDDRPVVEAVGATFGEKGKHSEKPSEFREKIKAIFSGAKIRLELFARQKHEVCFCSKTLFETLIVSLHTGLDLLG